MIQINDKFYARARNPEITEKGECGGSLTALMKFLLEEGIVDAVLAVKAGADIYDAVPVLINETDKILDSAGSLHCGTLNMAKIVEKYLDGAQNIKIAATTKPCDAMAINELIKRDKINKNNVLMMGLNCGGTLNPVPTRRMLEIKGINPDRVFNEEIYRGKFVVEIEGNKRKEMNIDQLESHGNGRRSNCRRCEFNIPKMADIAFGNWGVIEPYAGKMTFIESFSKKGSEIMDMASKNAVLDLKKAPHEGIELRNKTDKLMVNLAKKWQNEEFSHVEGEFLSVLFNYEDELSKCIKCFGCKESCPICYCSECSLNSEVPEWVDNTEIPPKPQFHMERLIHMVDSCINCGQCEDACPVDIPLSKISHEINYRLREIFDYIPGIDDKKPPLSYLFNKEVSWIMNKF